MLNRGACATAAIVLAAGESTRMPGRNKLLSPVDGVAMIVHVVERIRCADVSDIIVVTGHESTKIREALADCEVRFIHNPDYRSGLSTSLRAGIAAVGRESNSALICLGDMPGIRTESIRALLHAFDPEDPRICVPVYGSRRGHPVLWPARFFAEMLEISGDHGARHIIDEHAAEVTRVVVSDPNATRHIYTPDALAPYQHAHDSTRQGFETE